MWTRFVVDYCNNFRPLEERLEQQLDFTSVQSPSDPLYPYQWYLVSNFFIGITFGDYYFEFMHIFDEFNLRIIHQKLSAHVHFKCVVNIGELVI
jgi:hypothetical protein